MFKYLRNQASKSSVNSKEHPSSKKIFLTFIPFLVQFFLTFIPFLVQFFLTDCRSPSRKAPQLQHSSFRLPHAIRLGMITKHSSVVQSVTLIPFSNQKIPHSRCLDSPSRCLLSLHLAAPEHAPLCEIRYKRGAYPLHFVHIPLLLIHR
jgi:hypothetical protein